MWCDYGGITDNYLGREWCAALFPLVNLNCLRACITVDVFESFGVVDIVGV